ncbi:MAG: hypothetical protein L0271_27290 [Gemmatimonadetes bacterium]|nr:hypothetical protein [Gemmatimonadota bacterium]
MHGRAAVVAGQAAALASMLVAQPSLGAAQGQLVRGDLDVRLLEQGAPARVAIRYVLRTTGNDDALPLAVIPFGTVIQDVRATVDGLPIAVELDDGLRRRSGTIRLQGGRAAREATVELSYTVADAWRAGTSKVRVPVIAIGWPPIAALPDTFHGAVTLPAGHVVWDAFPSTLRSASNPEATAGFDVQVVPAVVTFRAAAARPLLTFTGAIELTALALLFAFAVFGWRRFRAEV